MNGPVDAVAIVVLMATIVPCFVSFFSRLQKAALLEVTHLAFSTSGNLLLVVADLPDLVVRVFDWKTATERTKAVIAPGPVDIGAMFFPGSESIFAFVSKVRWLSFYASFFQLAKRI